MIHQRCDTAILNNPHGSHVSLKTGKVLEYEKNSGLGKVLPFCENINKRGKIIDFDQPVKFCCWYWENAIERPQLQVVRPISRTTFFAI